MRASGEISEEEFTRKKSKLGQDKTKLKELLNDTDGRADIWLETAEKIISFAEDARKTFSGPSIQTKRTILSALGSNLLLKDKKLDVQTDSALLPMKFVDFPVVSKIEKLEPAVVTINKGRTQSFDQVRPMWLALP